MGTTFTSLTRGVAYTTTLLSSAARTVTAGTNGDAVYLPDAANGYAFILDVTAASTDAGDTLDAQVQTLIGDTWVPVCSFTQCLGNGGAKQHIGKVSSNGAQTMFEASAALAAGSIRNLCGDQYRVRWVIVDADADASFTFSVKALPM
jgi:hypothetical protein